MYIHVHGATYNVNFFVIKPVKFSRRTNEHIHIICALRKVILMEVKSLSSKRFVLRRFNTEGEMMGTEKETISWKCLKCPYKVSIYRIQPTHGDIHI